MPESAVRNGMGQGRLLDAERAKQEKMVDGIATLGDVAGKLARRIGQVQPVETHLSAPRSYRRDNASLKH